MITCKLGEKTYTIDFVSGRAMREMEEAWDMYTKFVEDDKKIKAGEAVENKTTMSEMLDTLAHWFCILFRNQFNEEDLFDNYPNDRLVPDIFFAMTAVQRLATDVLKEFPTSPAMTETKTTKPTSRK